MSRGGYRPGAGRPRLSDAQRAANRAGRGAARVTALKPQNSPAEPRRPARAFDWNDPRVKLAVAREINAMNRQFEQRAIDFNPFRLPDTAFPKEAIPPRKDLQIKMAMDSTSWASGGLGAPFPALVSNSVGAEGLLFLGYPFLAVLAQRTEYRVASETIADDATRKWIDFDIVGDPEEMEKRKEEDEEDPDGKEERRENRLREADKMDRVQELKDHQKAIGLRDAIYAVCRDDGFFGRAHLYLDFDVPLDGTGDTELATPVGDGRDEISKAKIKPGSFRGIRPVEAVWCYPTTYNAVNPLRFDWYNPQVWYVMGKEVHLSRLLTFIGHPVPDLLKPAYAFGGLSLSQLFKPYVDIWLRTRQSVGDLIHSFSVMVLKTDMQSLMQEQGGVPGGGLISRVEMFNKFRDNNGTFLLNEATEDFANVSAPLGGLHELQAQSQEHMCSAIRVPLTKFTGIQPSGLSATSEGEMRAYYDTIAGYQNRFMRPNLQKIIYFEMLSLWGEIDEELMFEFEPLMEMTEKERAEIQKMEMERDQAAVDMGAISPAEVRGRIVDDPELPYGDLDPEDTPDLLQEEEQGLVPPGSGRAAAEVIGEGNVPQQDQPPANDDGEEPARGKPPPFQNGGSAKRQAADSFEWLESDHDRDNAGKFTSKGGGGGGKGALTNYFAAKHAKEGKGAVSVVNKYQGAAIGGGKFSAPQYGLEQPARFSFSEWKGATEAMQEFEKAAKGPDVPAGDPDDPGSYVKFGHGEDEGHRPSGLNGVKFESWEPPGDPDGWVEVDGQTDIDEPDFDIPKGKEAASGLLMVEPDGRIWLTRPKGGFGGYAHTFPKGRVDEGMSLQANAIKEAYEETGLKAKITGFAGDRTGDITHTRYYLAEREGGTPDDRGWESEGVVLAPPGMLKDFLNRDRDRSLAKEFVGASMAQDDADFESKHPRAPDGKFGSKEPVRYQSDT